VRRVLWLILILAAATAITVVAVPALYIQPFKPQAADWLARAYALRQAAPLVTAVALPVVILSAIALVWMGTLKGSDPRTNRGALTPTQGSDPRTNRGGLTPTRPRVAPFILPAFRGATLLVLVGLTGLATWFSRQNHFEWMFAPPAAVKYVPAKDAATFLTADEMVMGIEVGGLSLAYPIRQMAYHHVVNDVIGTTPVVVTY
jgi:Protein of unknown function (DUF3179)